MAGPGGSEWGAEGGGRALSAPLPAEVLQTWTVLQDGPISRVIVFSLLTPEGEPWTWGDNSAGLATPHPCSSIQPSSLPRSVPPASPPSTPSGLPSSSPPPHPGLGLGLCLSRGGLNSPLRCGFLCCLLCPHSLALCSQPHLFLRLRCPTLKVSPLPPHVALLLPPGSNLRCCLPGLTSAICHLPPRLVFPFPPTVVSPWTYCYQLLSLPLSWSNPRPSVFLVSALGRSPLSSSDLRPSLCSTPSDLSPEV